MITMLRKLLVFILLVPTFIFSSVSQKLDPSQKEKEEIAPTTNCAKLKNGLSVLAIGTGAAWGAKKGFNHSTETPLKEYQQEVQKSYFVAQVNNAVKLGLTAGLAKLNPPLSQAEIAQELEQAEQLTINSFAWTRRAAQIGFQAFTYGALAAGCLAKATGHTLDNSKADAQSSELPFNPSSETEEKRKKVKNAAKAVAWG